MFRLTLATPDDFDLRATIGSYGFCRLAPNRWNHDAGVLHTVLRTDADACVTVSICENASSHRLQLRGQARLSADDRRSIKRQVVRMLRLEEDLTEWFAMHPQARKHGFGRLIRSATLFEDMIKTITSCNVAWPNTVRMNELLCEHLGHGGFPTPCELAACPSEKLKQLCKVGYRAERIVQLARRVADGDLDLNWFEQPEHDSDTLYTELQRIHGLGPYAAANILQQLGRHDRLPIDSECYRHYCEMHGLERPKNPAVLDDAIRRHYQPYQPFAFLAYWFELWRGHPVNPAV